MDNVYDLAAARARRPQRRETPENSKASFGKVYEIEIARRARGAHIPVSVLDEMDAAAALFDEMQDADRQVRFAHVGGRVVAALCDLDGNVVRPLSLSEAIGMGHGPETAA